MTEIKYLEDWEYDINSCIGCTYYFEECTVFKDIRQEADSAQDKVILSYRFLTGLL